MRNSLFNFLPMAPLLSHHDKVVMGKTAHYLKDKGGATIYYQHIIGGVEEGIAY